MSRRFFYNLLVALPLTLTLAFALSLWQTGGQLLNGGLSSFNLGNLFSISSAQAQAACVSGDPAAPTATDAGGIYFNSCTGKFRMYAKDDATGLPGWQDIGSGFWSQGGTTNNWYLYPTKSSSTTLTVGWTGKASDPPLGLNNGQNLFYGYLQESATQSPNFLLFETAKADNTNIQTQFAVTLGGQAQAKDFCIFEVDEITGEIVDCVTLSGASYWQQIEDERDDVAYTALIPANAAWYVYIGDNDHKDSLLTTTKLCVPDDDEENCITSFTDIKAATNFWGFSDPNTEYSALINLNKASDNEERGDVSISRDLKVLRDISALGTFQINDLELPLTEEKLDFKDVAVALGDNVKVAVALWEKEYLTYSKDNWLSWSTIKVADDETFSSVCVSPDGNFIVIIRLSSNKVYYSTTGPEGTWNLKVMSDTVSGVYCPNNDNAFLVPTSSQIFVLNKNGDVTTVVLPDGPKKNIWVSIDENTIFATAEGLSASDLIKCTKSGANYTCSGSGHFFPNYFPGVAAARGGIVGSPDGSLLVAWDGSNNNYFVSTDKFAAASGGSYAYSPSTSQGADSIFIKPNAQLFLSASDGAYGRYEINTNLSNGSGVSSQGQLISFDNGGWNSTAGNNEFVMMVGPGGSVARSNFPVSTTSWSPAQYITLTGLNGVWGSATKFAVVGNYGTIAVAPVTTGVGTFTIIPTGGTGQPPKIDYQAVGGFGNTIVAVGGGSSGAYSTNGGSGWAQATGLGSKNYGVWAQSASTIYVAAGDGIYKSTDYGLTFAEVDINGASEDEDYIYRAIHGLGNTIVAVGDSGVISYSTNSGSSWTTIAGNGQPYYGVTVTSATTAVAVGYPNVVDLINLSSSNVASKIPSAGLPYYWVNGRAITGGLGSDGKYRLFVVGSNGKIMMSPSDSSTPNTDNWQVVAKSSVDPDLKGAYLAGNLVVAVGDSKTVLEINYSITEGGNALIRKNLQVDENTWGGSAGTTGECAVGSPPGSPPCLPPSDGYIPSITTTRNSCPKGEFLVGVNINSLNQVTGLYCQKL
ncbi:MAG: hypothetical protein V1712_04125 [Patescibacteria group bacterium]